MPTAAAGWLAGWSPCLFSKHTPAFPVKCDQPVRSFYVFQTPFPNECPPVCFSVMLVGACAGFAPSHSLPLRVFFAHPHFSLPSQRVTKPCDSPAKPSTAAGPLLLVSHCHTYPCETWLSSRGRAGRRELSLRFSPITSFPGEVGGARNPMNSWQECPHCQTRWLGCFCEAAHTTAHRNHCRIPGLC